MKGQLSMIDELEVICGHALTDERTLSLATKVGLAFPILRERIVSAFLKGLLNELVHRLGKPWVSENEWTSQGYLFVSKPKWQSMACVGLAKEGPRNLNYFVCLDGKAHSPAGTELWQRLNEGYAQGKQWGEDNPWWKYVDKPRNDWSGEKALIGLWKKAEAIEYYATHLEKICKIAAPILDRACTS